MAEAPGQLRIPTEFRKPDVVDLRHYQEQALEASRPAPLWTREAAVLALEGWSCKTRLGKRIWCEDVNDAFKGWVSEEVAYRRIFEAGIKAVEA